MNWFTSDVAVEIGFGCNLTTDCFGELTCGSTYFGGKVLFEIVMGDGTLVNDSGGFSITLLSSLSAIFGVGFEITWAAGLYTLVKSKALMRLL